MRRGLTGLLAAILLLSGCAGGTQAAEQTEEPEQTEQVIPTEEPEAAPEGLTMELEHEVYDPSLTSYTYLLHNNTSETVEFGEPYTIERNDGGQWAELTRRDDVGWNTVGYLLEPGQTMALTCGFWLYEETPTAGEYRLVKDVGGAQLTAEFALGESVYTAEAPYGFGPLEDLPERYTAADAAGTGTVIFTDEGAENTQAVGEFLEKVSLGVPCQLRTIQDHRESTPMVIDVIFDGDSFLWRMRSGSDAVAERRLSYVVTDGTDLYLSDGADWESGERYKDQRIFLVPPLQGQAWVTEVEAMTEARLADNVTRYRLWSADGIWWAQLREDPTTFTVSWQKPGEGSGGNIYDLEDWDGLETAITGLAWREDGKLTLKCETSDGGTSRLTFDPEAGKFVG